MKRRCVCIEEMGAPTGSRRFENVVEAEADLSFGSRLESRG